MSSLSLKNINKIYPGNVQAVFDFNIEIADKEFIVFVGPSGCGKSTTLRMIAGLEEISSGELYIDNEYMNYTEPKDRNIAMVFQSYALYPHMTVYENIKFALKLRKLPFPVYKNDKDNEALVNLLETKKAVRKELKAVIRKIKKGKGLQEALSQRNVLYKNLYKLEDEIKALRVPVMGIDEYKVYCLSKQIEDLNHQIEKNNEIAFKKPELAQEMAQKNEQIEKALQSLTENLEFYKNNEVVLTKLRKPTRDEMDIEINKVAEQIDLVPYLYRKPAALSGGQRQRVALGRAMVRKPKVFLMDEPLSNLDAKLRVQTRNEIRKLHEEVGATTIYVTHDQIEAMTMADRIVVMKDGYIQQIGTPHEVFNNPANKFVGGFIGSSPMNFIKATYSDGKFSITTADNQIVECPVSDEVKVKLASHEGKTVTLGIRPNDVYIAEDTDKQNPSAPLSCKVNNVELIGTELVVHTNLEGLSLIVKTRYETSVMPKSEIKICLDTSKLYVFDHETELRIA